MKQQQQPKPGDHIRVVSEFKVSEITSRGFAYAPNEYADNGIGAYVRGPGCVSVEILEKPIQVGDIINYNPVPDRQRAWKYRAEVKAIGDDYYFCSGFTDDGKRFDVMLRKEYCKRV